MKRWPRVIRCTVALFVVKIFFDPPEAAVLRQLVSLPRSEGFYQSNVDDVDHLQLHFPETASAEQDTRDQDDQDNTGDTDDQDLSSWLPPSQPAILPLLPFEVNSAGSTPSQRKCAPPGGQHAWPARCCLGSYSTGGAVRFVPKVCAKPLEAHDRVANYTQDYLQRFPVDSAGSSWPRQDCDVCRIIDFLTVFNWTFSMVGDSMSLQTFTGLECELRRRGYNVTFEDRPKDRPPELLWQYGVKTVFKLTVRLPGQSSVEARLYFYFVYRPNPDNVEVRT
jgi:hypothetical protein